MTSNQDEAPSICVIIAARNASATIGAAIRSALAEAQTYEVILVDDASDDDTADVARQAADGDGRLRVLVQAHNIGPAAARNAAIEASSAPYIAVLDGDDVILPGRFGALLACGDWAFVADNILFLAESAAGDLPLPPGPIIEEPANPLSLVTFVDGNISRGSRQRGELGFLKPLMRRDFLDEHGLRYNPEMRLGEDFDLYVRALLAGASFGVTRHVGYVARVRSGSLSASHSTADLAALLAACDRHITAAPDVPVLRQHRHQCFRRHVLRAFLDVKAADGWSAALRYAVSPPAHLLPIAQGVLSDKLAAFRSAPQASPVGRTLLPR